MNLLYNCISTFNEKFDKSIKVSNKEIVQVLKIGTRLPKYFV